MFPPFGPLGPNAAALGRAGVAPDRLAAVAAARPAVVKLNTEELQRTLGLPDRRQAAMDAGARELLRAGAGLVLVTDGPAPAHLYSASAAWRLQPPGVSLVNPIGSGANRRNAPPPSASPAAPPTP